MSKMPRKNCNECTLRHRTCVFESPSHRQCTRCIKNNLICFFKKSGEYYLMSLHHFLLHSTQPLLFSFFCPEQGRRNDLLSKYDGPIPQDIRSLLSTPACSTNIKSDSVHCGPLSCVASGSRCHTADYLKEKKDADASKPCFNKYSFSNAPPPWVHVFS